VKTIGIDIGTTTISVVLLDGSTKEVLDLKAIPNTSAMETEHPFERIQDAEMILDSCDKLLHEILSDHEDVKIDGVGVTGQMHGILYLDAYGKPVTPLYTWQDGRGDLNYEQGKSYAAFLEEKTETPMASGFGAVTHFYNSNHGLIPEEASCFCTIADMVAMRLARRNQPLIHQSMAASIGLYDLEKKCFDYQKGEQLAMDMSFFPNVADEESFIGTTEKGIPVTLALGDNQASFLGAIYGSGEKSEENAILLNIGTGSQISIYDEYLGDGNNGEVRPYLNNSFLWVGSPLCGGYSYHLLKDFFTKALMLFGEPSPADMYSVMNQMAERLYEREGTSLVVDTRFRGTRTNPEQRGSIGHIGEETFQPEHLTLGFLKGIGQELYELYEGFPRKEGDFTLIGSGNALRKNPLLCRICSDLFGKELILSSLPEEAACGSAFFAMMIGVRRIS